MGQRRLVALRLHAADCIGWCKMANEQNLIPHQFTSDQSREQAAINGRKGGKASGKARREKRLLRDALQELLDREYTDKSGNVADGTTVLATQLFKKAQKGDLRAWQILRDTVGQMPVQRIETVEIPPEAYQRVAEALADGPAD